MRYLVLLFLFVFPGGGHAQSNPHADTQFDCQTCHQQAGWHTVSFDHDTTGFSLTGAHKKTTCLSCHDITSFKKVGSQCRDCHQDVHENRLSPECNTCHAPSGWSLMSPVKAHESTTFQLLGAHASLDCYSCHRNERNTGFLIEASECVDCHRTQYAQTTNPNHTGAGFSLQCDQCHSLIRWQPAIYNDHDALFPIFSGSHAGEWSQCSSCHDQPGNYQAFTCFTCHEHNKASTDGEHDEVSGYIYESNACLSCHPQGGGGDD
ncbi:MAG TPA: hypothetical protein ENJ10_03075 [Caldithrix abyssi]|uniref:Cytochrome c7-like domain-containing protein n=1 Tax=Caldithrix abyssi TaxID=187145 RepID=A0A7V1PUA9_CALAY|nr:hypothetical protein [Caldithrix abyssi]